MSERKTHLSVNIRFDLPRIRQDSPRSWIWTRSACWSAVNAKNGLFTERLLHPHLFEHFSAIGSKICIIGEVFDPELVDLPWKHFQKDRGPVNVFSAKKVRRWVVYSLNCYLRNIERFHNWGKIEKNVLCKIEFFSVHFVSSYHLVSHFQ